MLCVISHGEGDSDRNLIKSKVAAENKLCHGWLSETARKCKKTKTKKIKNKVNQFTPKQQLQHFETSL